MESSVFFAIDLMGPFTIKLTLKRRGGVGFVLL